MYDVVIIGGGPAGQSAALFTSKGQLKTLLLDNEKGLTQRALIRNHYGADDVPGGELVAVGRKQAEKFGTEFNKANVTNVIKKDEGFTIETEEGDTYEGKQIILATGANSKLAETIGLNTKPSSEPYVKHVVDVDAAGRTNIEGIWAAGTAAGVSVHTIITSGDGAKVAVNLLSDLKGERYVDHDAL
ncbi:thioredoxin reductase [Scopulibacillus daqui]|uniref:Thioredoxin reductase n=1 Tax=Scopulibacillus daqui TaxID=1469162 RepID=A0ABS2Q0L9_9BACL|nr:FAD-dependent oxidoreductase [Scopulibacillus daqui]MBM7645842.1 thioredoxin reductase [Scopulibacillus daqui]